MSAVRIFADRPLLITGASGFVGGYLIAELRRRNISADAIIATSIDKTQVSDVRETVQLDLSDVGSIDALVERYKPGAVIHLAAIAAPADARRNQELTWTINFDGTRHLAFAILKHVPDARLLFAGSAEAYGASFNTVTGLIPETAALRPASAYGATKAAADVMLGQLANEGLDVVCTRSFNHTGPGQPPAYVVPAFAEQIAKIEAGLQAPVLKVGNLDAARDFLDVRDVVRAYASAALSPLPEGAKRVFNVCSGEARTIKSVLEALLALSKVDIAVETDPERLRPSDVPHAAGDNRAIKRALNWAPEIQFEKTLIDTLDHYLSLA